MTYTELKALYKAVVNDLHANGYAAEFREDYIGRRPDKQPGFAIIGGVGAFALGRTWGVVCSEMDYVHAAQTWAPAVTDKIGVSEAHYHTTPLPEKPTKLFYVTLTWDEWPEGGSYGTTLRAANHVEAEAEAKREMAELRAEERESRDVDLILQEYEHQWHVVDCWPVDDFVGGHS